MNNTITILDVGHGNSTIINDNGKICIVDTGESSALIDFLFEKEIKTIDYLFLSHSDKDHIGKAIQLLSNNTFIINNIVVNTDSQKNSKIWDDLAYEIEQQSNKALLRFKGSTAAGDEFTISNTSFIVNSPSPELAIKGAGNKTKDGEKISSNTICNYFTVKYKDNNIVALTGDIDDVSISHFSTSIISSLKCKHLVFPHHGGYCGDLNKYKTLLSYVCPEFIIFSNGKRFKNNPRTEIIEIIKRTNPTAKILCTELSDLCKGCDNQMQCAGNIIIDMETNTIVSPNLLDFEKQKQSYKTKLC